VHGAALARAAAGSGRDVIGDDNLDPVRAQVCRLLAAEPERPHITALLPHATLAARRLCSRDPFGERLRRARARTALAEANNAPTGARIGGAGESRRSPGASRPGAAGVGAHEIHQLRVVHANAISHAHREAISVSEEKSGSKSRPGLSGPIATRSSQSGDCCRPEADPDQRPLWVGSLALLQGDHQSAGGLLRQARSPVSVDLSLDAVVAKIVEVISDEWKVADRVHL